MNQTIQALFQRKSVRVFTDQEIGSEEKQYILQAATQAPTAGNQQLYTILDITDEEIKKRLVDTCDHQPMIAKAKMVLIFLADCKKWYEGFLAAGCEPRKPGVGDLMLAVEDAMIAAQNAVVAAQSLGIGSCYIGDIMENYEEQRELLHLPEYVFPAGMLIFGYPTRGQLLREKPERVAMEHIVHENGYRPMKKGEYEEMWTRGNGEKSYEEWMQAFCARKYNSDFSREMTRSVEKYLEQFQGEKEETSDAVRNVLCFGDSNTYGYNTLDGTRFPKESRWPGILAGLCGSKYNIIEEGCNGRTTVFVPEEEPWKCGKHYLEACLNSHKPLDLVVMMLGSNDMKKIFHATSDDIVSGIGELVDRIHTFTRIKQGKTVKILLISPPEIGEEIEKGPFARSFSKEAVACSKELGGKIGKLAKEKHCYFLDAAKIVKPSKEDQLHLMPEEHRKLARAVYDKILFIENE